MGEELPLPGTATFHFTESVADQESVYFPSREWPWPDGPRQRDQYFAPSPVTSTILTSFAASGRTAGGPASEARRAATRMVGRIMISGKVYGQGKRERMSHARRGTSHRSAGPGTAAGGARAG